MTYRSAPLRVPNGIGKRQGFGMLHAGIGMKAAAENFAIAFDHRANHGVGAGLASPLLRKFEGRVHALGVHDSKSESMNFSGSKGSKSSAFSPMPM